MDDWERRNELDGLLLGKFLFANEMALPVRRSALFSEWFALSLRTKVSNAFERLEQVQRGKQRFVPSSATEWPNGNGLEGSTGLHWLVLPSAALFSISSREFSCRTRYSTANYFYLWSREIDNRIINCALHDTWRTISNCQLTCNDSHANREKIIQRQASLGTPYGNMKVWNSDMTMLWVFSRHCFLYQYVCI